MKNYTIKKTNIYAFITGLLIVLLICKFFDPFYVNSVWVHTDTVTYEYSCKSKNPHVRLGIILLQEILTNCRVHWLYGKISLTNPWSYPGLLDYLKFLLDENLIEELQKQYRTDSLYNLNILNNIKFFILFLYQTLAICYRKNKIYIK